MLFPEEDAPLLKAWIVKRLENTSDADADVLADYVLALLRHDGEVEDVRKLCEEEIPDFLSEDSSVFVNDVFEAIRYKSYLPGAPPPPKRQPPATEETPFGLSGSTFPGLGGSALPPIPQLPVQNGSKKRTFQDRGDPEAENGRDQSFRGGRAFKQPRRGRGGRGDNMNGARGGRGGGYPGGLSYSPIPQGMPAFDPNNPMEAIIKMQQMGIPLPPLPDFSQQQNYNGQRMPQQQRRRGRCRDYDIKGYCARGQNCMFEHGPSSMYVPPQGPPTSDEYDPNQAAMMMADFHDQMPPQLPTPQSSFQPNGRNSNPRDNRRGGRGGQRGKGRAPFSADGPVHDKTKSTIVVENIPEENFTEDEVRGYFSQFGNIVEVAMQPYKRLATIKFDNWGSANAAYRSPKVMFDNRFVKVFWYKEDGNKAQSSASPGNGPAAPNGHNANGGPAQDSTEGSPENEIDMEDFMRKQDEAQKQHEEKQQKKQEVEKQRLELEKRQKDLMAKQQEEKQKLLAKLAAGSNKGGEGDVSMGDDGAKPAAKPTTQTEALRAQLALLEEEAKMLGLDPNAADESSAWSGRGRGRGRGGPFRARGGFPPRGSFRGGYRGRGGGGPAAYAAFSLDNRPRKVAVTGLDLTTPERDEALRQHLFTIGEFTDVQSAPSITNITFKDRKTAEKFFYGLPNKEIPGISGPVELAWVNNASSSTPPPLAPSSSASSSVVPSSTSAIDFANPAAGAARSENGGAKDRAPLDVSMGGDAGAQGAQGAAQDHAEMDYDVGDENDWGIE